LIDNICDNSVGNWFQIDWFKILLEGNTMTVAVLGLGYVGLPLVIEFGKKIRTIGLDISEEKVDSCKRGIDPSRELPVNVKTTASAKINPGIAVIGVF
jgi:UDP-N-acetyl-D-mannosaminuronate dehydrogenase